MKMHDLILNKYELMWMMVLFDLPVIEKKERKDATEFRNFLLDNGFSMVQYSIYTKLFSGKDACEKYYRMIHDNLPTKGKVDIITITDRQYGNIISYNAGEKRQKKQPDQFLLF
ncbi:CRISPR-associated endoribonuclease Cas2 [Treponema lecithinolyticum ATCC 700332]|uniref:CRISPR-associated endoribonuclease Cas2 n=2 Tax=Treponema lecithinolyticum TaxID=53418 RepID=A0ABN0NY26_TRELE|nr:CRISPR-associated endoribonuclease Cas2 [Treponema lecithinolyticum ATCC 700332]